MRGIYEGRNIITDTVYYGQSVNIEKRIKTHIYNLRNNKHNNPYLQNAWNKYGKDNFEFKPIEIIEDINIPLTPIETKYYNSTDNKYNIKEPDPTAPLSKETKQKMSVSAIGNKNSLGCKKIFSVEHKKNLSIAHKGKDNHQKGRYISDIEHKTRSDSQKQRRAKHRSIVMASYTTI